MANTEIHRAGSLAETAEEILNRRAESLARETIEEEAAHRLALLLFRIAEEWYCVRVSDVREIFQEYDITTVPGVPDYILGVVNVRGEILSITDPATLMHIGAISLDGVEQPPAIVIVNGEVATAIVVDEIGDIAEIPDDSVEPPISIIDRAQAAFISGSVHVGDNMVGLINIERMLEPVITGGRH
ncbi:MAG: chemotaxis protein CheW [Coriobacteriia bacterium]|nr:chemotaxis protein CheW [Coriobacteriia bacterium]